MLAGNAGLRLAIRDEAHRAAQLFKTHDKELLFRSARHAGDVDALVDIARKGRAEISNVLETDRTGRQVSAETAWDATGREEA